MRFEIDWTSARTMRLEEKVIRSLERMIARSVLESKGKTVSVTFVSSLKMRIMNRTYRGFDRPTDVLSFSALEGERMPGIDPGFAGDVIICLPYVRASAKEQNVSFEEEVIRMFVHGAMHCLGYDHMTERDAKRMLPVQEDIIHRFMHLSKGE